MQALQIGILCTVSFSLFGCVGLVDYKFDSLNKADNIELVDSRADYDRAPQAPCTNGGVSNIGDKNVLPSKIELLRSRFGELMGSEGHVQIVVKQFNLRLNMPDSCQRAQNAAIAGALSGAFGGVATSSGGPPAKKEGVLCELKYQMNGRNYSGREYVEAQTGINSLNGPLVSTKNLIEPITKAIDKCIETSLRVR